MPLLTRRIRASFPQACLIVSVMTAAGKRAAQSVLIKDGVDRCFYLPYDLPWAAWRVVRIIRPDLFITTETEIWANILRRAKRGGARILMINGRISVRSMGFYRKYRRFWRQVLANYDRCSMIDRDYADRLVVMGAEPKKVLVSGNMKFDQIAERVCPESAEEMRRNLGLPAEARLWVAGSTRQGEEEQILQAYRAVLADHPDLHLIIAPRHIDRAQTVAKLVREAGFEPIFRSALKAADANQVCDSPASRATRLRQGFGGGTSDPPSPGLRRVDERQPAPTVLILDTMGELFALYGLATLAFCGASLVPLGGQNPLEPAAWGRMVLYGPSMEDFAEAKAMLEEAGAGLMVADQVELARQVGALLANPEELGRRGEAGRQAIAAHKGASERNLALIMELIDTDVT